MKRSIFEFCSFLVGDQLRGKAILHGLWDSRVGLAVVLGVLEPTSMLCFFFLAHFFFSSRLSSSRVGIVSFILLLAESSQFTIICLSRVIVLGRVHPLSGQSRENQRRDSLLHHTVVCSSSNFDMVSIVMELSLAYIRSPEGRSPMASYGQK